MSKKITDKFYLFSGKMFENSRFNEKAFNVVKECLTDEDMSLYEILRYLTGEKMFYWAISMGMPSYMTNDSLNLFNYMSVFHPELMWKYRLLVKSILDHPKLDNISAAFEKGEDCYDRFYFTKGVNFNDRGLLFPVGSLDFKQFTDSSHSFECKEIPIEDKKYFLVKIKTLSLRRELSQVESGIFEEFLLWKKILTFQRFFSFFSLEERKKIAEINNEVYAINLDNWGLEDRMVFSPDL